MEKVVRYLIYAVQYCSPVVANLKKHNCQIVKEKCIRISPCKEYGILHTCQKHWNLEAYIDSDYAGDTRIRKSTSRFSSGESVSLN